MTQIAAPFQQFFDTDGSPLNNGYIYLGEVGTNPLISTNQILLYWDEDATLPASQPLRTTNGYISRAGSPARVYTAESNYSILVRNSNQVLVYSVLEAFSTVGKTGYIVNTIADLRAFPLALTTGDMVKVLGYYTAGDMGGGDFIYNSASAATEDNGAVIDPSILAGRFLRIVPDRVIPQMWGAKGDGVTDDSAAIQAFVDYIEANRSFVNNGFSGSASVGYCDFAAAVYRLSTTINVSSYITLTGQRALFKPDSGVDCFTFESSYQNRIDNIVIIGGRWGLVFETGNVDTSTITIENCEFQDQTSGHIQTSALSASTLFRIKHCKFYNNSSSSSFIGIDLMGGNLHLTACWVTTAQKFIRNGDGLTGQGGTVILDDLFGVPRYAGNGGVTWVDNSASVLMRDCRFGGEADGAILVCNEPVTATATQVVIDNCGLFPGDVPIVEFNYMPDNFQFTNNYGAINSWEKGFLFNAGSTTTNDSFRGSTHTFIVKDNSDTSAPNYQGSTIGQNKTYCFNNEYIAPSKTLFTADKVAQFVSNGGFGWGGTNSGVTIGNSTNGFGAATRTCTGSSATYNGAFNETYTTGLNGLATGMYTVVVNVEITTAHITTVQIYAGENEKDFRLAKGRHVLCMPTYFVSGTDQERVGFGCSNMNSSQNVKFGPVRIFAGVVDITTENNVVYGSAAPTTLRWELGDRVINSAPTVGQPKSWVCTVAGTPGTWVSEGNL
ncbi:pectate lyase superfamily protein [Caudoviricetes sp.]|nr:pectate lyase superfamily protein [Caudoviricetes sp.]